jgi:transposase-like protein
MIELILLEPHMDLDHFSCPNPACSHYAQVGSGNIALYTRYGKKQVRLLVCNTCGKTFSELKGTLFWDSRLDWETIERIYRSLLDGQGIRATARSHNLSKNTVKRYLRLAKKDFNTIEQFLRERGVIGRDTAPLRELVDTHVRRSVTMNHAAVSVAR